MTSPAASGSTVSRRRLLRASVAGAALLPLASIETSGVARLGPNAMGNPTASLGDEARAYQRVDGSPAAWRTWILASPDELRPEGPADPTETEIAELLQLQAERDEAAIALARQWGSRPAVLPWTELANAAWVEFGLSPLRQGRANGILQVAMYDAVVASYDAQEAFGAPWPAEHDPRVTPLEGIAADGPSFPSAEAAVAGAAAAALTALLPDAAPARFTDAAEEAATSRLVAGVNVRRDVDAGLAMGQTIGERAVVLAADDASPAAWDGADRLTGPGYWNRPHPGSSRRRPSRWPARGIAGCWTAPISSGRRAACLRLPGLGEPARRGAGGRGAADVCAGDRGDVLAGCRGARPGRQRLRDKAVLVRGAARPRARAAARARRSAPRRCSRRAASGSTCAPAASSRTGGRCSSRRASSSCSRTWRVTRTRCSRASRSSTRCGASTSTPARRCSRSTSATCAASSARTTASGPIETVRNVGYRLRAPRG